MKNTKPRHSVTLIEILFAIVLLAIVMLGVASAFQTAQQAQQAAKEYHAATLAAASMIEDISEIASDSAEFNDQLRSQFLDATEKTLVAVTVSNDYPAATARVSGYTTFDVHLDRTTIGAGTAFTSATGTLAMTGGRLQPAPYDCGLWPQEVFDSGVTPDRPGYVVLEALDPLPGQTSDVGVNAGTTGAGFWPYRIRVTVYVIWRSAAGSFTRAKFSSVVLNPSVSPNPPT